MSSPSSPAAEAGRTTLVIMITVTIQIWRLALLIWKGKNITGMTITSVVLVRLFTQHFPTLSSRMAKREDEEALAEIQQYELEKKRRKQERERARDKAAKSH